LGSEDCEPQAASIGRTASMSHFMAAIIKHF